MTVTKTRRGLCLLVCLALLLSLLSPCFAETGASSAELTCAYRATGVSTTRSWQVSYSDDFFTAPANVYNHSLARASLGLALSAFRDWTLSLGHLEDHAVDYLHTAGFTNLNHADYNVSPTQDTIATLIGSKAIGDTTVIAVAVSGGGYKDEWKSNFDVRDEVRAYGFGSASQKVQQRIRKYIEDYHITGDIRLWIAGYSRAAAVSNITAADMTDSGLFTNVYAYTFATPRTTREPGNYDNIFNIVGKTDPVPLVPLPDWGYERYGITLFTPAQEYDSDFAEKAARADTVAQKLTGFPYRNSPIMNHTLRNVLYYLLAAYPTPSDYQPTLGATLIKVWGKNIEDMTASLEKVSEELLAAPETANTQAVTNLVNYVENNLFDRLRDKEYLVQRKMWNPEVSATDNIMHEHNPDVYIEWMYSSEDPEQIFSSGEECFRFVVYGDVTLRLWDIDGFVQEIHSDGTLIDDAEKVGLSPRKSSSKPSLYWQTENNCTIITVPQDRLYMLDVLSAKDQEIRYFISAYNIHSVTASLGDTHTVQMKAGGTYSILLSDGVFSDDGAYDILADMSQMPVYSPEKIIQLESMNVFRLSLKSLIIVSLVVAFVLFLLILVELILLIIRRARKVRRADWVTITTDAMLSVFFYGLAELGRYHLNAITSIYVILKTISVFWIVLIALKGALYSRTRRLSWMLFAGLLLCLPGDASSNSMVGMAFSAASRIVLIIALLLEKRSKPVHFIISGALWAITIAVLLFYGQLSGSTLWIFISYSLLIFLLPAAAMSFSPAMRIAACAYSVTAVMVGISWVQTMSFTFRAIAIAIYLLALFLFSLCTWPKLRPMHQKLPKSKPMNEISEEEA